MHTYVECVIRMQVLYGVSFVCAYICRVCYTYAGTVWCVFCMCIHM